MLFTLFAPAANVNAASKRTKALTAYQKKLKKLDSKIYKFALVYLDKDSIPELVITSKESTHAIYGEIYTYNNGKLKNLKYAGSDFGQFIYSPKKSVACNSSWINGYGAVSTFYRFSKTGKSTKLKRFDAIVNPKTSYQKLQILCCNRGEILIKVLVNPQIIPKINSNSSRACLQISYRRKKKYYHIPSAL